MPVARDEASLKSGFAGRQPRGRERFKDGSVTLERYIDRPSHVEVRKTFRRPSRQRRPRLWEPRMFVATAAPKARRGNASARLCCAEAVRNVILRPPPCVWRKRPDTRTPAPANSSSINKTTFYFIEVNARIQVEHPVTEPAEANIDLVKEQIRVTPDRRAVVVPPGRRSPRSEAVFECLRINAEDPANDFRPSPGLVTRWQTPGGPGVRSARTSRPATASCPTMTRWRPA